MLPRRADRKTTKRKQMEKIKYLSILALPVFTLSLAFHDLSIGTYSYYTSEIETDMNIKNSKQDEMIQIFDEKMSYLPNCLVQGSFNIKNIYDDSIPLTVNGKSLTLKRNETERFSFLINKEGMCSSNKVKIPVVGYKRYFTEYVVFEIDENQLIKPKKISLPEPENKPKDIDTTPVPVEAGEDIDVPPAQASPTQRKPIDEFDLSNHKGDKLEDGSGNTKRNTVPTPPEEPQLQQPNSLDKDNSGNAGGVEPETSIHNAPTPSTSSQNNSNVGEESKQNESVSPQQGNSGGGGSPTIQQSNPAPASLSN